MRNPIVEDTGGWKIDDEARTYRGIRTDEIEEALRRPPGVALEPVPRLEAPKTALLTAPKTALLTAPPSKKNDANLTPAIADLRDSLDQWAVKLRSQEAYVQLQA